MENIVVKEITPNEDKTIINIKLENGEVIKAFKTEDDLYTLGGYYDYEIVKYLFSVLNDCKELSFISLKDCLDVNGISSSTGAIQIPEGMSPKEYFENERKNKKTYTYPELESIKNKILQEKYGHTRDLNKVFNNLTQQNDGQTLPGKK